MTLIGWNTLLEVVGSLLKLLRTKCSRPVCCPINTIEEFDATLHRPVIEGLRAVDSKLWCEWTVDDIPRDIPRFLNMKDLGKQDFYHEAVLCLINHFSCHHFI